ncbi:MULTISPECIES: IclR family transcriptional regulator domain-containing protein [Comamonadaceae]|jgi:IclR family pca regulon transcriptional regulator|uniref:IclR family transcriptional regulator C-terminal domain-containing protein n=4 Tax=Comamonadaceae TaxID=80864 RepID=A0AAX3SMK4_9BURK|nr:MULTISPECIES: IclR family transcriptional regulator C-terminal domain-containing protein [Comamonadaceae]KEH09023.1 IclR family transcriptional regulator [Delftia sp. 670]KGH28373.1 IclR family transcriptional regulator [Comamonas thiooxydans]MDH1675635.1 helix-turn-helix domain-containing protein [Comamonas aquatica]MDH1679257.1 helix-turn-helix domain-containing protein [Comamonas aquatica]QRI92569.1 helix-turn-helix domain-containing protein [Delftia lacustris]
MQDKNFVESLRKGLGVLTCFDRRHTRLTLSEVARLTQSTPASARRSLSTLVQLGYLESDGKLFWMQPKSLLIAYSFLSSRPMPALAQPLLDALSERTRESASLGTLLEDDAIIIGRSTARRSLSTGLGIGSRLPVYCSAIGRVLLSGLPQQEARARLEMIERMALTHQTVTDLEELLGLLDTCRQSGWSCSDGELELGVRSMAAPVRDPQGNTIAAMSIAVRAERLSMSEFKETFLMPLKRARNELEKKLYPQGM